jgi:hypothetical protein
MPFLGLALGSLFCCARVWAEGGGEAWQGTALIETSAPRVYSMCLMRIDPLLRRRPQLIRLLMLLKATARRGSSTLHSWVKRVPCSSPLSFDSAIAARRRGRAGKVKTTRARLSPNIYMYQNHSKNRTREGDSLERTISRPLAAERRLCRAC